MCWLIMWLCYWQKVAKCTNRSTELLEQRTFDAALSALEIIDESLSISLYSEKLLEMKAEALYMVCDNSIYFSVNALFLSSWSFLYGFWHFYKPQVMVSATAMWFGGILQLRKYEEAIRLCEQSLSFAEKNFASLSTAAIVEGSGCESYSTVRLWRWCLISKCYFHTGRLEAALDVLQKLEPRGSSINKY